MTARFNLPELSFANKSAEQIEVDVLNRYEQLTGRTLEQADPRMKFIQSIIPILVQQRSLIDFSAKQNLLSYAYGENIEHLGALTGTAINEAKAATTVIRFFISSIQPSAILIPKGTRMAVGNIFFESKNDAYIPIGNEYVDVSMTCITTGVSGNGFLPGQINALVDPLPFIDRAENITTSDGGADKESDDSYTERIRIAPESFSVAGSTGAYEYFARGANQLITDVIVYMPSPGVVEIRVLLANGQLPSQEILDQVYNVCNYKSIRPLTDNVQVLAPEAVHYDLDITYFIESSNVGNLENIKSNIENAISEFVIWQKSKLGRDINPSELIRLVVNAGAKRVALTTPNYEVIENYQVAVANTINVTFGGIEND